MMEADVTGDSVLPTIFSVNSPFSEAGTVGLTTGIIGGFNQTPPFLKDEAENSTKPLKSVAPTEMVIWVSHGGPGSEDNVLVTVDVEKHQLSIWRYVYIKPKDIPVPLGRKRAHSKARKRLSVSGVTADRRWSTTRRRDNDLSVTLDRMILGGRIDVDATLAPIEHGRMKAAYWMEMLHTREITDIE
jgi:hypothetical protein